jgi:subtilisin family serine protease
MRRTGFAITLALFAVLGGPLSPTSGGANAGWRAKVDSTLLRAAESGRVEFLALMAEQADVSQAARLATKEEKGRYVFERLAEVARATQPAVLDVLDRAGAEHRGFWIANLIWARGGLDAVRTVASLPEVAFVYPNGRGVLPPPARVGTAAASSPAAPLVVEPNVTKVRAPQVWALGYRGQGAVVAGADTGVEWTHPALKSHYRGWNGTSGNHNYSWHDSIHVPDLACPGSSTSPCDDDVLIGGGHGTHTVGTMVGDDGGSNQIGIAPGAKWIACRNMIHGVGVVATYLECMQWFIAPTDLSGSNPDPAKAPHVVNNSWACVEACPPLVLKLVLGMSRAAGIVYVVSAGNDGSRCSTILWPLAIHQDAFTVGATDSSDVIAGFSSRGPVLDDDPLHRSPDISAPGVGVRSSLRGGTYGSLSGTSMAGPHVAGVVALIISAKPSLAGNVTAIESIIEQTAVPRTTTQGCGGDSSTQVPNNVYGWGRVDALAAVQMALAP